MNSRAYRVFNERTKTMMESINVVIDDKFLEKVQDVDPDVETSDTHTDVPEEESDSNSERDDSITLPG
ncbi:gag-pol polyprotein, partial [Trifolium medium]|nr:gag-pol polyprotein [Trifolium medium]